MGRSARKELSQHPVFNVINSKIMCNVLWNPPLRLARIFCHLGGGGHTHAPSYATTILFFIKVQKMVKSALEILHLQLCKFSTLDNSAIIQYYNVRI
jgi:hypothetical protein